MPVLTGLIAKWSVVTGLIAKWSVLTGLIDKRPFLEALRRHIRNSGHGCFCEADADEGLLHQVIHGLHRG